MRRIRRAGCISTFCDSNRALAQRRLFASIRLGIVAVVFLSTANGYASDLSPLQPAGDFTAIRLGSDLEEGRDEPDANDSEQDDDDEQMTPYIEELFLGRIIYPQEQGEVQLTGGYFHGDEALHDSTFLFEVEYGITDKFQIGVEAATQFAQGELFQDLQQCSVELYYNFYSNRRTGRAYGAGFEFGLPIDAADDESRTCVYEPFFVAYQDYRAFAVNLSAALEIADPVGGAEATEVGGDVTLAAFRRVNRIATILEANVAWDREESIVRLAPGLYWRLFDAPLDLAVSFPIGLTDDAPDLGVFVLLIYEFDAADIMRR